MKLSEIIYEVPVLAPPEKTWDVLVRFGDVGDFLSVVSTSHPLNGNGTRAILGAERYCELPNGSCTIYLSERITAFEDGKSYTYDVFDWKHFPLARMENRFEVRPNGQGNSVLQQRARFRLRPGFLTVLAKGKLRKGIRETLLAYKHKIETGESNTDVKRLSKKYREL